MLRLITKETKPEPSQDAIEAACALYDGNCLECCFNNYCDLLDDDED